MYSNYLKRAIDFVLAVFGLIILFPVFVVVVVAIYVDDPGPVIFKQKRVGKGKKIFWIHKFRSMKINTPDVPTHMLTVPDAYITRVGRIIRKLSLDELPQIYDILIGKMAIIGPRPALWSQADLISERDKYAANDVRPGLSGWAQINGRDELSIDVKAKLDGVYVECLNKGGFSAFLMDAKCFLCTFVKVFKREGVIEGINQMPDKAIEEKV